MLKTQQHIKSGELELEF